MDKIPQGFKFIRDYIDDLLNITRSYWVDNLQKLYLLLKKSKEKRLKYIIQKHYFGKNEMEYIGF